eukprot:14021563-Alexandrium_andersonii.AAC.1
MSPSQPFCSSVERSVGVTAESVLAVTAGAALAAHQKTDVASVGCSHLARFAALQNRAVPH